MTTVQCTQGSVRLLETRNGHRPHSDGTLLLSQATASVSTPELR